MTSYEKLIREEPIRPNSEIIALDESTGSLVLSDFAVHAVNRYSFCWKRGSSNFVEEALELLASLGREKRLPMQLVLGWHHEEPEQLRIRHLNMASSLRRVGWRVRTERKLGLAMTEFTGKELSELPKTVGLQDVGWFVVFGTWATLELVSGTPFRNTIESFCWTHSLAPSCEFYEAVGALKGSVAFAHASDDCLPSVTLVSGWLSPP